MKRKVPGGEYHETEFHSVMPEMFPEQSQVLAEWYSGYLIVPQGEIVEHIHSGFASVFERYTIYTVERGKVLQEQQMTRPQYLRFRYSQFLAYKRTEEYKSDFMRFKDEDETEAEVEDFLFEVSSDDYLSRIFNRDKD